MLTKAEQSELIEELTSKLQDAEIKLAETTLTSQYEAAQAVVKTHIVAGMSLGLLPLPLFDIAVLSGAQLNMLRSLCKHYDVDFNEKIGKSLLSSLASGSLPVLTVMGLSSVSKIIPGIGSIAGGLSVSVSSGAMMYAAGQVFIKHFEAGGTLADFDSKQWLDAFKEQFEDGKDYAKGQYDKSKSAVSDSYEDSKGYFKGIKEKFIKPKEVAEVEEVVETETDTEVAEETSATEQRKKEEKTEAAA